MEIQWPLVIFAWAAGCGGVVFSFVGLSELLGVAKKTRVPATIVSLVLLVIGGCASVLHLGQPSNIMAAATNILSFSGISVELIMLGINFVLGLVYLILYRNESATAMKVVGAVAIVTGLLMAFVTGHGYVMDSQEYWNNAVAFGYLGSGMGMGATLFTSLMTVTKAEEADFKKIWPFTLGCTIAQGVLFLIYGISIGFVGNPALYWGGAIVVGSVGSILFSVFVRKQPKLAWAAFVCAAIGGICFRCVMFLLGYGFLELFDLAAAHSVLGLD